MVLTTGFGFGLSAIIANFFGASARGNFQLLKVGLTLAARFLTFGFGHAYVFLAGRKKTDLGPLLAASLITTVTLGVGAAVVGTLNIDLVQQVLFPKTEVDLLASAIWLLPLLLLSYHLWSLAVAGDRLLLAGMLQAGEAGLLFGLVVLAGLLIQPAAFATVIICWIAAFSLANAAALARLIQIVGVRSIRIPPPPLWRELATYGSKVYMGQLLLAASYRLDTFIVGYFLSLTDVGIYAVAASLSELAWLAATAIGNAFFPKVARRDENEMAEATCRVSRLTILISAVSALGVALFAYPILLLLFPSEFLAAIVPLLILLPGSVAFALYKITFHDLAARGKPEIGIYATGASVACMVLLDILLIPSFGIEGAALAATAAYFASTLVGLIAFLKASGASIKNTIWPTRADLEELVRIAVSIVKRPR